jgi:GTP cyclohydrolase I
VAVRGVKCPSTAMTTVALRGDFREKESLCREFDQAIAEGAKCVR